LRWGVALAVGYRDIAWVLAPLQAAVDLIAWVVWLVTVVWLPLVRAAPWVAVAVLWQLGRTHGTVPGHAPRHSANLAGGDLETLAAHPHVTEHPLSQTSSTLSGSVAVILPLGGAAMTGQSDWTASTKVTVVLTALGVLVAPRRHRRLAVGHHAAIHTPASDDAKHHARADHVHPAFNGRRRAAGE
jgi:hypothetical protein